VGVGVRQTVGLKGTNELSKKYALFIVSIGPTEYLQAIVETYNLDRFNQNTYSNQLIRSGHKSDLVQMVKNKNQIGKGYVTLSDTGLQIYLLLRIMNLLPLV
jgi:adenosylhomocysteine nucleosidase